MPPLWRSFQIEATSKSVVEFSPDDLPLSRELSDARDFAKIHEGLTGFWTQLRLDHFKNGRRHGRSIEWHAGGSKSLEGEWSEGVPKGTITVWSADGLLKTETSYGNDGEGGHPGNQPEKRGDEVKKAIGALRNCVFLEN